MSFIAGLKGGTNRRLIPMSEIKLHRSEDDAWTVLKGRVYNITRYLKFHPGGMQFHFSFFNNLKLLLRN